ncbi:MAG: GTP cyclohydrolase II [Gammaproteobacteria bacterium]|nr:GTP cyclohydrolase II [Gammaproteobacteria bacterium]
MGTPNRLEVTAEAALPTLFGNYQIESFRWGNDLQPNLALSIGLDLDVVPTVRIHSECITGDTFASVRCDCGHQLQQALRIIRDEKCGLLIYLRQEGRGIGIENKLRAYALQQDGLDTVEANLALGLPIDSRSYDGAAKYLHHLGIAHCNLLTNNPHKVTALIAQGIATTRIPLTNSTHRGCQDYLATKRTKMGHDC